MYLCTVQNDLLLKNFVPSLKFYFHHSPERLEGQISLYLHFVGDETGTLPCDLHFSYWRKRNWNFGHSILLIPQLAQAFFFFLFFFCRRLETEFLFWLQPAFSVRDLRVGREAWRLGTELLGLRRTYTNYVCWALDQFSWFRLICGSL